MTNNVIPKSMEKEISTNGRLVQLETVIERGLGAFVEVGRALAEIRDSRLYRETHATFDDYLRERWDLGTSHAYRKIEAAEVAEILSPMGEIPSSERQARELAPLRFEPERMTEAWTRAQERAAAEGRKVTARDVSAVVAGIVEPSAPKPGPAHSSCPTCGSRVRADQPLPAQRERNLRRLISTIAGAADALSGVDAGPASRRLSPAEREEMKETLEKAGETLIGFAAEIAEPPPPRSGPDRRLEVFDVSTPGNRNRAAANEARLYRIVSAAKAAEAAVPTIDFRYLLPWINPDDLPDARSDLTGAARAITALANRLTVDVIDARVETTS